MDKKASLQSLKVPAQYEVHSGWTQRRKNTYKANQGPPWWTHIRKSAKNGDNFGNSLEDAWNQASFREVVENQGHGVSSALPSDGAPSLPVVPVMCELWYLAWVMWLHNNEQCVFSLPFSVAASSACIWRKGEPTEALLFKQLHNECLPKAAKWQEHSLPLTL